jgi:predicted nucleic acid-binding protein
LGIAIPYSDVDTYLSKIETSKGCILDTNFLIALTEENHKYYDDSKFIYEKLVEYKVPIYCTVTVRTEFIDYQRRIKVTESLMDMLAPSSQWKISSSVREVLKKHKGWIELCKEFLTGKLLKAWSDVEEALSLNYIDMRDSRTQDLFQAELKWENMYSLSEETALGSNDAMILNVLDSSTFPFVVSADYDLAYGVLKSKNDKIILVPDSIYIRNLKGLRF